MNILKDDELELVCGGAADFSDVTAKVDSTEKIIEDKSFLQKIGPFLPGMFR